ncbi:MAG: DUF1697 domain-containing protein [Cyanobacteria bacterium REEB65]|nr:DUF1697 domain-containing protein [Cyanobacteria bacterium REEB65]
MAPSPLAMAIALLRGINVGGKNSLPMRDLIQLFEDLGGIDVRTYIQSGNLVFRMEGERLLDLAALVEREIAARFGLTVPVVLRTHDDLLAIVRANPFLAEGGDSRALHVAFLADRPSFDRLATLDPQRSSPDRFAAVGTEIFLHCPGGYGKTKLTNAYFDRQLGTTSTVRNWATVLKLVELAKALPR